MTLVWDISLPPPQKLVLLKLADNAHDDGLSARPGIEELHRKTDLSIRAVQYALKGLREAGLIEATQFAQGGRKLVTEYRLLLQKGAAGASERVQLVRQKPGKGALVAQKGAAGALARVPYEPSRTVSTGAGAPPNGRTDDSTQALVAFYVEQCNSFGWNPLTKWRNQIAKQIIELRAEKPVPLIQSALRIAADERKSPSALAHVVADIEAGRSGGGQST
jgi:DNA-binding transcriptional ArsR family regulator